MNIILDVNQCSPLSPYDVKIDVNERALLYLDFDIDKKIAPGRRLVKFYLDKTLSLEECNEILKKLERLALKDGAISISTTGRNFNELMKCIGMRKSKIHHEMHIDDNDIRRIIGVNNIICDLNFSRISCDCYFSDRYLMNFRPTEFSALCTIPDCKFNRERLLNMRIAMEKVWDSLVPSFEYMQRMSSFEKTELIFDYVSKNANNLGDFLDKKYTPLGDEAIAALLLDNYLARVNCRAGQCLHLPTGTFRNIIATVNNGKTYCHSLVDNYRFIDLEPKGYVDCAVTLETDHKYRKDFEIDIISHAKLDDRDYITLKNHIDMQIKILMLKNIDPITEYDSEYLESESRLPTSLKPKIDDVNYKKTNNPYTKQKSYFERFQKNRTHSRKG